MNVDQVVRFFDHWAPPAISWERDNVGIQVGNPGERVRGILVALDATESVIEEARKRKTNLIISHHPLLFHPLRSVTDGDPVGKRVRELVRSKITLFSAHTNLDFTRRGTSFALAEALKLQQPDFLVKSYSIDRKIVTFVPAESVENVASAMAAAGAGRIGNYEQCSFRSTGTGTFRGNAASTPRVGRNESLENVAEIRLEMIAPEWKLPAVLKALKESHPYEEAAFDIYQLGNKSNEYGMGVVGELKTGMTVSRFLDHVRKALHVPFVRYSAIREKRVRTVAVCGGSGSELLGAAISAGADAYVTADVKYHQFEAAENRIALVDAGHYETEVPVLDWIVTGLKHMLSESDETVPVHRSRSGLNPVHYA